MANQTCDACNAQQSTTSMGFANTTQVGNCCELCNNCYGDFIGQKHIKLSPTCQSLCCQGQGLTCKSFANIIYCDPSTKQVSYCYCMSCYIAAPSTTISAAVTLLRASNAATPTKSIKTPISCDACGIQQSNGALFTRCSFMISTQKINCCELCNNCYANYMSFKPIKISPSCQSLYCQNLGCANFANIIYLEKVSGNIESRCHCAVHYYALNTTPPIPANPGATTNSGLTITRPTYNLSSNSMATVPQNIIIEFNCEKCGKAGAAFYSDGTITHVLCDGCYKLPQTINITREQRKKDGLCPECGDAGEWKMMALFCKQGHGKFAG